MVLIGGYFLSYVILGMTTATLGPALPYLAENTGVSLKAISALFVGHRIGYMLGSFAGGRLYDRVRGNRLMALVLLIVAAGMTVTPLVGLLPVLVAVAVVIGAAEGTVDVGGNILLVWTRPPRIGSVMNALHLFFGLGAFLTPLILAMSVRSGGGIRWGYWFLASAVLPVASLLLFLPSPRGESIGRREETPGRLSGGSRYLLPLLFTGFMFLHVAAESSFGGWVYTYALRRGLADRVAAGYLTSAFWGSLTVGRLLAMFLALRVQATGQLSGGLAGALLGASLLLVFPQSPAALWIGSVLFGLSLAGLFPGTITLASQRLPMTGGTTGLFLVGSALGAMVLPWLIGQFFESAGSWVFPVGLLCAVAGAVGVLVLIMRSGGAGSVYAKLRGPSR